MFKVIYSDKTNGYIRSLQELIEKIDLITTIKVDDKVDNSYHFVNVVIQSQNLIELDLSDNIPMRFVTEIIKNNNSIKKLSYIFNLSTVYDKNTLIEYFQALSSNTTITHLNFKFTHIDFLSKIIEILKTKNCIRYINLSGIDMQNEHVLELAKALRINKCIESLDITHNPKINISATRELISACQLNRTLTSFEGENNRYNAIKQCVRRNAKNLEKVANMLINGTNNQAAIFLIKYVYCHIILDYLIEKKGKTPEDAAKLIKIAENKLDIFVLVAKIPLEISQCISEYYQPNLNEVNNYLTNFRSKQNSKNKAKVYNRKA